MVHDSFEGIATTWLPAGAAIIIQSDPARFDEANTYAKIMMIAYRQPRLRS